MSLHGRTLRLYWPVTRSICTYQVLRRSFENIFKGMAKQHINDNDKLEHFSKDFTRIADEVFYKVINENSEAIYRGVKANFNESDKIDDSVILRNWFVDCLYNWLNNAKQRDEHKWSDDLHQSEYSNFSDLYHEIFNELVEALTEEIDKKQSIFSSVYHGNDILELTTEQADYI